MHVNNRIGHGKKIKYDDIERTELSVSMKSIDIVLEKLELILVESLDSGWNGDGYIVKNNRDELLVLKLERMDKYNENNKFESEYYRQIDFDELVAREHPNNFMVLENHGFMKNCFFLIQKQTKL